MNKPLDGAVVIPYEKVDQFSHLWKDKKPVLVGGCFDILHYGHVTFLKKARESGGALIVALEGDTFMKKNKKRAPIHTQEERASILANIRSVDFVLLLPLFRNNDDYLKLTQRVRPRVIAITKNDPHEALKKAHAAACGARLAVVTPKVGRFSSSAISPL